MTSIPPRMTYDVVSITYNGVEIATWSHADMERNFGMGSQLPDGPQRTTLLQVYRALQEALAPTPLPCPAWDDGFLDTTPIRLSWSRKTCFAEVVVFDDGLIEWFVGIDGREPAGNETAEPFTQEMIDQLLVGVRAVAAVDGA